MRPLIFDTHDYGEKRKYGHNFSLGGAFRDGKCKIFAHCHIVNYFPLLLLPLSKVFSTFVVPLVCQQDGMSLADESPCQQGVSNCRSVNQRSKDKRFRLLSSFSTLIFSFFSLSYLTFCNTLSPNIEKTQKLHMDIAVAVLCALAVGTCNQRLFLLFQPSHLGPLTSQKNFFICDTNQNMSNKT